MANKQINELSFATNISDATTFPANNNASTYEAQQVSVGQLSTFIGARAGAIHNLCDVYWNKSNKAIDNPGALPGWTGEYVTNADNVYPDLYTWLKTSHSELCITRVAYDSAISSTGECRYFVIDEVSGSIRFPKYNYTAPDYPWIYCFNAAVPQTTSQGAAYTDALISKVTKTGDTMAGQLIMDNGSNGIKLLGANSANYTVKYANGNLTMLGQDNKGILLDGSDNNTPYYTNGTTNTPLLPVWGIISGTITDQTDLTTYINSIINGANLMKNVGTTSTNISVSASSSSSSAVTQTYTFSSNGWCFLNDFKVTTSQGSGFVSINGVQVFSLSSSSGTISINSAIPVSTGTTILVSATGGFKSSCVSTLTGIFFPEAN